VASLELAEAYGDDTGGAARIDAVAMRASP
jgi:hypothetical protein